VAGRGEPLSCSQRPATGEFKRRQIAQRRVDPLAIVDIIKTVAQYPVDRLIVYDIDRLARKSSYQMLIEEELARHGTLVEYVVGQYENNDEGRLQKQIRASIAEYEKAKILERMKRGKRGKAKSGFAIVAARPPYGYQVQSEPHKCWLVVDEREAAVVRLVYEWFLYGEPADNACAHAPLSLRAIATKLSASPLPTRGDTVSYVAKKDDQGV